VNEKSYSNNEQTVKFVDELMNATVLLLISSAQNIAQPPARAVTGSYGTLC